MAFRRLRLLAACLLLSFACTRTGSSHERGRPAPSPASPQAGGTLRVAVATDPAPMNPLLGRRGSQYNLWRAFYPSLFTLDANGARPPVVHGDLARRWQWSDEERALTVVLRQDRFWEDTIRVRGADVVRSYAAYQAMGRLPARAAADTVVDPGLVAVESVDDSTLRLHFRPGFASWRIWPVLSWPILPALKLPDLKPVFLEASALAREPLSAASFRLLDWRPGLNLWMGPNPLAPRRPWVRRVAFEPCPGVDARVVRLLLGGADVVCDVPVYRLSSLTRFDTDGSGITGSADVRLHREGIASVEMVFWNMSQPFANSALREALWFGVDRDRMVDALLTWRGERYGGAAGGILEPAGPARIDSTIADAPVPWYDPVRADRILDEAGWTERDDNGMRLRDGLPLRIDMIYDRGNELRERIVTRLEEDLARLGITLAPVPLEGPVAWQRFRSGVFQTALMGFRPPVVPDLAPLWSSRGAWNGGAFASARVDSLIAAEEAAATAEEVERCARAVEAEIRREKPVTFLIYREAVDLLSPRVRDFEATPYEPYGTLERTWLADTTAADTLLARQ